MKCFFAVANTLILKRNFRHMQQRNTAIIADDDKMHIKNLAQILESEGYEMRLAIDTEHAIELISKKKPSFVFTTLNAYDYNLDSIVSAIDDQRLWHNCRLIVFSEDDDEELEVKAFDQGAYDFLLKPLRQKAFLKRMQLIYAHRKIKDAAKEVLVVGNLKIDVVNQWVSHKDKRIQLQERSMKLLQLLATHPNQVFSREEIKEVVWKDNVDVDLRSVDVHILKIRKHIAPHIIKTIKGVGYRFSID